MAKIITQTIGKVKRFRHIADPIPALYTATAGKIETGQVIAFNATTGKAVKYVKGDANAGNIFGIYCGEEQTLTAGDVVISVSTLVYVGAEDIVGIATADLDKARAELKHAGVYVVEKITGRKEAY